MEDCHDERVVRRYADILSDAGFKAVFGDGRNGEVLKDLLNVLLPERRRVRELRYMTTELPQFSPYGKSVRLDLRCRGRGRYDFHRGGAELWAAELLPEERAVCGEVVLCGVEVGGRR